MPSKRTPEQAKATALKAVARESARAAKAEHERNLTLRVAHAAGCTLREIEEASGIPFKTVSRIIERTPAE